jgi:hypothetical protein
MLELMENFDEKVQEAAKRFPDEVVAIRYSTGYDWSGDPAVYFRVLLSDNASDRSVLGDVTSRVSEELFDSLQFRRSDYIPYFYFRSKSEQDKLKDPQWG